MADMTTNPVPGIELYTPEVQPQAPQISLYGDDRPSIMDNGVIDNRAKKYDLGLGEDSPGRDQLTNDIRLGNEDHTRTWASAKQDLKDLQTRQSILANIAATKTPGEAITPDEMKVVDSLRPENYEQYRNDPATIMEKLFSKQVVEDRFKSGYQKVFDEATDPTTAQALQSFKDKGGDLILKQQSFIKLLEDTEQKWSDASYMTKGLSIAEGLVPFLNQARMGSMLPGSKTQDLINDIWLMSPSQATAAAKAQIDAFGSSDPYLALTFARNLVQYSTARRLLDNSISIADLAMLSPIAKGMYSKVFRAGEATKDLVAATAQRTFNPGDILADTGNIRAAAPIKANEILQQRLSGTGNPQSLHDLRNQLPVMFNPDSVINGSQGSLAVERAQRIANMLRGNNETLANVLDNAVSIDRLDQGSMAQKAALERTDQAFSQQFDRAVDGVLSIRTIEQEENAQRGLYRAYEVGRKGTIELVSPNLTEGAKLNIGFRGEGQTAERTLVSANDDLVVQIGRHDQATLFDSAEEAARAAKEDYGMPNAFIRQKGEGYVIEYHKAVSEIEPDITKAMMTELETASPTGPLDWMTRYLSAGTKEVDKTVAADMLTATYGSTGLHELMRSIAKPLDYLKTLRRKEIRDQFTQFVSRQRDVIDPATGQRGTFSTTVHGFESEWMDMHHVLPNEKTTAAYFALVDLVNKDYIVRNLSATGGKVRLGLEMHSLPYSGRINGQFAKITPTPHIEGKFITGEELDKVIDHPVDAGFLLWDKNLKNLKTGYFRKNYGTKETAKFEAGKKGRNSQVGRMVNEEGYKVVQLTDIGEKNLREAAWMKDENGKSYLEGKRKVHFIVTKELNSEPLGFVQVPNRPGGHVKYPNGHYVSQAKLSDFGEGNTARVYYGGDANIHYHPSQRASEAMAARMNVARELLITGDARYEDFARRNIAFPPEDFKNKFSQFREGAEFDLHEPFVSKPSGTNLENKTKLRLGNRLVTGEEDPWNLYKGNIDLRYMGERDHTLTSFNYQGSATNPHWNLETAKLIDPVSTQLRATSELLRDTYMGDLKMKAASRFVAEFGHLLEGQSVEDAMKQPIQHLFDPSWRKDLQGIDRMKLRMAKDYRRATMNLFGTRGEADRDIYAVQQKIVDVFHDVAQTTKATQYVEAHLLHRVVDPSSFFKKAAFTMQVGLFVPHQLFVQAMTMANTMAWNTPARAVKAMIHAAMNTVLKYSETPENVRYAAKLASDLGWGDKAWKADNFIESYAAMKRSGFSEVGGEHIMNDSYMNPPLIKGAASKVYDWTRMFFNGGERWNRHVAWAAAYDEWRTANPHAIMHDADAAKILYQANRNSGSMSVADKAMWQQGVLSIPSQYMAFAARISEQFLGKEYSLAQKAYATAVYGTLFGYPVAAGVALPIWPWHKSIKETLMSKGIDTDDNTILKMMNDGLLSMGVEKFAGTKMDVGPRFAGGGLDTARDIYKGTKSITETLGGPGGLLGSLQEKPSPSLLIDTASAGFSFAGIGLQWLTASLKGEPRPGANMTYQRFIDFTNQFSAGNSARKFLIAANYGEWIAKNEMVIAKDITGRQAWLSFIAGLTPQRIQDKYLMMADIQERKHLAEAAQQDAAKWLRRSFKSDNEEDAKANWDTGFMALKASGMNSQELSRWWHYFLKNEGTESIAQMMAKYGSIDQGRQEYIRKQYEKQQKENASDGR